MNLEKKYMKIHFFPEDVWIEAEYGESILEVAKRAQVFIPTGCLMGSCHACEVELEDGSSVRSCISSVPNSNKDEIKIYICSDPLW